MTTEEALIIEEALTKQGISEEALTGEPIAPLSGPGGEALPRSTPEAQGMPSSAVLAFVDDAEHRALGLHSLMVVRRGRIIAEGWWDPYSPTAPHMLYSLSKSFAATAAGLAAAEGFLSLDDAVLSFFPNEAPAGPGPHLAAMRLRHLLSMSTGHDQDTTGRLRAGGDWVRAFLALPVEHAPGTHFVYNSGATYLVSAVVQKATGQTLLEFLGPRLFRPLGIAAPTWESSPQGINVGGWGLSITTEDIARFGLLYLQDGEWNGTQLLPAGWVAEATSAQVSNGDNPDSDWAQGYGYQFWRCRHGAYRGDGAFGQFCVVLPEQEAVVAITAGSGDMGGILSLVWEHLLPALGPGVLPADPAAQDALRRRLAALSLPAPEGDVESPFAASVSGRTYAFGANAEDEYRIETARWDFSQGGATVTVRDAGGVHRIETGASAWRHGTTTFGAGTERPVAARGAWAAEYTYVLTAYFCETPHAVTLTAHFTDGGVQLDIRQNVSFGPTAGAPLTGKTL
ncbi:MAG: serine hydrolase domain-containing protein [Janthinobacterium lividum]